MENWIILILRYGFYTDCYLSNESACYIVLVYDNA